MIMPMYSVRDSLTGFMTPVLEQNDVCAMRNFRMACETSDSLMRYSSSDFALYHIANFDTVSGVISPVTPVELVCSGNSFVGDNEK